MTTEPNSVTAVAEDTAYVSEAMGYLPSQFRPQAPVVVPAVVGPPSVPAYVASTTRPVWAALVGSYSLEIQACEVALWGILQETLLTAVGVGLDVIGRIVGLARNGLDDADYQAELLVQIIVLKSNGHPDDIVRVVRQFLNLAPGTTFTYTENADATTPLVATALVEVQAPAGATPMTDAQAETLIGFINAAAPVGPRVMLGHSTVNDSATMMWSPVAGPALPAGQGWGSAPSTVQGSWASVTDH